MIIQDLTAGGGGRAFSAGGARAAGGARLRRGRVTSFDYSTWKAVVELDGSSGAATLAVGEWVNPYVLEEPGTRVAVLLFDDNNPNDGLILGPHGGLGGWDYFTRDNLPGGNTFTIPTEHQMRVKDSYTVNGAIIIEGELVVD